MNKKDEIKLVVFDLDGTIYNGNQLVDGALETIDFFKKNGLRVTYFTNNSSRSRTQLYEKLKDFSIELNENDVYSCSYAAKHYIEENKFKNIYILGSQELVDEVSKAKITVCQDKYRQDIDTLLVGMDTEFTYCKLADVYEMIQRNDRLKIIVCNMDYNFPTENGIKKPGCGAIASVILNTSGRKVDFIIGKPSSFILKLISKEENILLKNMLIIGDSYESDIQMAINSNVRSILIDNDGSKHHNITTVNSIKNIPDLFRKL